MTLNRQIILTALVLFFTILLFGVTDIDLSIQDFFYNFSTNKWILGWHQEPYRFIFYDGIKRLLIIIAVLFLLSLIVFWKKPLIQKYKQGMIILILSAIFVPAVASGLKSQTNMPCPKDEVRYGGVYPRIAVWQHYTDEFKLQHPKKSKCWPAGHASGGFALLSLFFLFKKRKNKILGLAIGFITGWSMGFYKMIIGDHFFSHTVITMLLSWFIILLIAKSVYSLHLLKKSTS